MFDLKQALEEIAKDPIFANLKPARRKTTSGDKLIDGFQKILDFYEANGRLPENRPEESKIYHNWIGVLKRPEVLERCRPYDTLDILPRPGERLPEPEATEDLFDIPEYMKERLKARKEAEYIGKHTPCTEFELFKSGFKEISDGLKSGRYRLVKFSVKHLTVGSYFVEDGMIGYLASFNDEGVNRHGNRDGRTRVIYDNGTEADIRYKTITKNLSVTGYSIVEIHEQTTEEFEQCFSVSDNDIFSGTIYVLRSKSEHPQIASVKNLYKIGFTKTSLSQRISNARNEPTYLCADVEVVATWNVFNIKTSTLETLIHRLFSAVKFGVKIDGHTPEEWFVVPLREIEKAIKAIINRQPISYDHRLQQIVYL